MDLSDKTNPVNSSSEQETNPAFLQFKEKLDALRQRRFTGESNSEDVKELIGEAPACSITLNSQYKPLEVNIDPGFLFNAIKSAGVEPESLELYQLIPVCATLASVISSALDNAREKAHRGSSELFENLMQPNKETQGSS